MKLNLVFCILFVGIYCSCFAQDTTLLKRSAFKLSVAVDKDAIYQEDIKSAPYVLPNNVIQLYPGETVFIELEQENGIIKNIRAVKEIKDSTKTLTISFTQVAKKKVHEQMILHISNPFNKRLIYKCHIYLMEQKKWVSTDVYPVEANLSAYETWPSIITSIGLGDWSFQTN